MWDTASGTELPEKFQAVPSNHNPHVACDPFTVAPDVRTLVSETLAYLAG
ncbi:hypothetical protein NGB36_26170 [Streptomyces sp. RB6PN25]|uniref:Uncharacterized protein n=1 Tax=Streptomyces humicola TaxID=2953240 RepID=A0ABT1Q3K3_9ACTN|nr:hypothetical protein [Streptomyces humicola]MCQ4083978.1 hypothetical protein [Streptomyces humicola]